MGSTVSEILGGVYDYLGRPTQDKLNLGHVLPILLDVSSLYLLDLQISSENHLLKQYTFTPSRKDDDIVTAPGFSVPVLMEIRDAGSTSDSDWRSIITANASDIASIGHDGTRAVAFYGQAFQTMMRWSFDPIDDWAVEARLWYEPVANQPASLADSPKLSVAFTAMLKLKTAMACIPYCGMAVDESTGLAKMLQLQIIDWEKKWHLWVFSDRNAIPVQKRDFRGNRRRGGYGNRMGGYGGFGW